MTSSSAARPARREPNLVLLSAIAALVFGLIAFAVYAFGTNPNATTALNHVRLFARIAGVVLGLVVFLNPIPRIGSWRFIVSFMVGLAIALGAFGWSNLRNLGIATNSRDEVAAVLLALAVFFAIFEVTYVALSFFRGHNPSNDGGDGESTGTGPHSSPEPSGPPASTHASHSVALAPLTPEVRYVELNRDGRWFSRDPQRLDDLAADYRTLQGELSEGDDLYHDISMQLRLVGQYRDQAVAPPEPIVVSAPAVVAPPPAPPVTEPEPEVIVLPAAAEPVVESEPAPVPPTPPTPVVDLAVVTALRQRFERVRDDAAWRNPTLEVLARLEQELNAILREVPESESDLRNRVNTQLTRVRSQRSDLEEAAEANERRRRAQLLQRRDEAAGAVSLVEKQIRALGATISQEVHDLISTFVTDAEAKITAASRGVTDKDNDVRQDLTNLQGRVGRTKDQLGGKQISQPVPTPAPTPKRKRKADAPPIRVYSVDNPPTMQRRELISEVANMKQLDLTTSDSNVVRRKLQELKAVAEFYSKADLVAAIEGILNKLPAQAAQP